MLDQIGELLDRKPGEEAAIPIDNSFLTSESKLGLHWAPKNTKSRQGNTVLSDQLSDTVAVLPCIHWSGIYPHKTPLHVGWDRDQREHSLCIAGFCFPHLASSYPTITHVPSYSNMVFKTCDLKMRYKTWWRWRNTLPMKQKLTIIRIRPYKRQGGNIF